MGAFNVYARAKGKLRKLEPWQQDVGIGPFADAVADFFQAAHLADRVKTQLTGGVAAKDGPASPPPPLPPLEAWPVPEVRGGLAEALGT